MRKKISGSAGVKRAQLNALRRELALLQITKGENAISYCSRTMDICSKMRFHGETIFDTSIMEKILRSLSPKFDYEVC